MAYRAYQSLKSEELEAAAEKIDDQQTLLRKFSTLFAVGPRLRKNAEAITDKPVVELIRDFPRSVPRVRPTSGWRRSPWAAWIEAAIGSSKAGWRRRPSAVRSAWPAPGGPESLADSLLRLMGADLADLDAHDDPRAIADREAGGRVVVLATGFDENPARVMDKLSGSNLSLMLSLREGFGLTGWEAIAAEVP